jgi:phosphopantothenoylcysteine decarboxylase/phosphopantothenate--cysteine ligase
MRDAVMARAAGQDVVIMAAAVADFTSAGGPAPQKLEREGTLSLQLEPTPDILAELGENRRGGARPVLVGFAAQAGPPTEAARRKRTVKGADLIVANDISAPGSGFDVTTNQVVIVSADDVEPLPLLTKVEVAGIVLDRIERLLDAVPAAANR